MVTWYSTISHLPLAVSVVLNLSNKYPGIFFTFFSGSAQHTLLPSCLLVVKFFLLTSNVSLLASAFVFQEDGTYQTRGIDMAVTQERVILLDTQVRFMCKCNAAEMSCLFFHLWTGQHSIWIWQGGMIIFLHNWFSTSTCTAHVICSFIAAFCLFSLFCFLRCSVIAFLVWS